MFQGFSRSIDDFLLQTKSFSLVSSFDFYFMKLAINYYLPFLTIANYLK